MTTSAPPDPTPVAATDPLLECDLVMKGGITSGVVYPLAVCELATVYRLRSVGGSSAGAIAAAAAACAELGRASGGFEALARLPHDLTEPVEGTNSRLFTLFQPQPTMRRLFRLVTSGLGTTGWTRTRAMLGAALKGWLPYAAAAAAPGIAIFVIGLFQDDLARWTCLVAGALLILLGLGIGIGLGVFSDVRKIPSVGFGLTSGATPPGATDPALTPWLHKTFQELAGRTVDDPPVTFGDLDAAGITLQLMTTNLSRRQPMAMPWANQDYSFDPAHFRALFPESVVARMESAPAAAAGTQKDWLSAVRRTQRRPLQPFPMRADLPIVVGVRMSLSFPGLIAAVPLEAVDFSLPDNKEVVTAQQQWREQHPDATPEEGAEQTPGLSYQRNWFSDGGICANLPLQFFDSALPRRPTFAINLAPFPHGQRKSTDEADNSYLPLRNEDGLARRQTVLKEAGVGALKQFGSTIIDTARTWVDEGQQFVPGYRDRIVTVFHDDDEGGMNLNMKHDVVTGLSERGRGAADRLVDVFAGDQPGVVPAWGWDNHRWLRFRTAMAAFSDTLGSFRGGFTTEPAGTTPYRDWAGAGADGTLPSYKVEGAQRAAVNDRTQGLLDTADEWQQDPADAFTKGAPEPRPTMRLVPSDRVGETGQLT
jgi:predicted acylesterase/phospholipase RssA